MATDKNSVKNLFTNLKSSIEESSNTPIQAIMPVKKEGIKDESPFTVHLPTKRLKMLKLKAAEEDVSIKELINQAVFSQYGF